MSTLPRLLASCSRSDSSPVELTLPRRLGICSRSDSSPMEIVLMRASISATLARTRHSAGTSRRGASSPRGASCSDSSSSDGSRDQDGTTAFGSSSDGSRDQDGTTAFGPRSIVAAGLNARTDSSGKLASFASKEPDLDRPRSSPPDSIESSSVEPTLSHRLIAGVTRCWLCPRFRAARRSPTYDLLFLRFLVDDALPSATTNSAEG